MTFSSFHLGNTVGSNRFSRSKWWFQLQSSLLATQTCPCHEPSTASPPHTSHPRPSFSSFWDAVFPWLPEGSPFLPKPPPRPVSWPHLPSTRPFLIQAPGVAVFEVNFGIFSPPGSLPGYFSSFFPWACVSRTQFPCQSPISLTCARLPSSSICSSNLL